jgi:hypothetical protein
MATNALYAIKEKLKAGARPNKYRLHLPSVEGGPSAEDQDILAKAASLPEASIGVIDVYNQGRKLPIAGDKTYSSTWDVTFYNTQALELRGMMEKWMKQIDDVHEHNREWQFNKEYMQDLKVEQLDGQNEVKATYEIYNAWPSNISSVDLADDAQDTVSEFTVTFTYSHWQQV